MADLSKMNKEQEKSLKEEREDKAALTRRLGALENAHTQLDNRNDELSREIEKLKKNAYSIRAISTVSKKRK